MSFVRLELFDLLVGLRFGFAALLLNNFMQCRIGRPWLWSLGSHFRKAGSRQFFHEFYCSWGLIALRKFRRWSANRAG